MSHTPGPWIVGQSIVGQSNEYPYIYAAKVVDDQRVGKHVATVNRDREADDNAAFIVRACNAHEDLLRACRELFALAVKPDEFTEPERQQLLDRARAARAKAEGTTNQPAPQG